MNTKPHGLNCPEKYFQLLNAQSREVSMALDSLLSVFATNNEVLKANAVAKASRETKKLTGMLDTSDIPEWLSALESACDLVLPQIEAQNRRRTQKRAKTIVAGFKNIIAILFDNMARIRALEWSPMSSPFDFEDRFRGRAAEIGVSILFDKLISDMQAIIDSRKIDSARAIEALSRLIASLKQSRKMSTFTDVMNWDYAKVFLKRMLRQVLLETPILKNLITAAEETIGEIDMNMDLAHKSTMRSYDQPCKPSLPGATTEALALPAPNGSVEFVDKV
jgi:hypothetical protein